MSCSTVKFDQIYAIIHEIRGILVKNYQASHGVTDETVYFRLDTLRDKVVETNENKSQGCCTVSWDSTDANLRSLARGAGEQIEENNI